MAERMDELFAELRGKHEELNIILSSIEEILVVLDKEGMIKLGNESFKKMVGTGNVEGRFYWEVLRSPELSKLVKRVSMEKKNIRDEIEIYNQTFLCSISFLTSGEIIIVLHDITDLKQLERMKKDIVANISHELRTPLTAIKGFVETLEVEEEIKNVQYLEIIKRHTDRVINIVNDLLVLSELEEKAISLQYEEVLLPYLIENVLKMFHDKTKTKGISLKVVAEPNFSAIKADPFQLEQMFINLIDNAIKYTEHGEVEVRLRQDKGRVIIEVQDTGIGIPLGYQSRIFERFFVVDKSRSRRLGGTGLGLSIVKHIVLLHNGTIDIMSAPGKGTTVIVALPAQR
jgi:two-component system phosphate regulon sensor histidine kinase PhoR